VAGWVFAILVGMAGFLPQSAQTPKTASFLRSVSISLPKDILSETVQISYFWLAPSEVMAATRRSELVCILTRFPPWWMARPQLKFG